MAQNKILQSYKREREGEREGGERERETRERWERGGKRGVGIQREEGRERTAQY